MKTLLSSIGLALGLGLAAPTVMAHSSFSDSGVGQTTSQNSLQAYEKVFHIQVPVMHWPLPTEHHAEIKAALNWSKTGTAPTLVGKNGVVMYAYGESHPDIVCAPLNACTIELLGPDKVTSLSIGDSVRWLVQKTRAGQKPVIIIKPTRAHLQTNLVITTLKGRIYYLDLTSDARSFVPMVGFYNPITIVERINQKNFEHHELAQQKARFLVYNLGSIPIKDLDFNWRLSGSQSIRPVRVFSAEGHVYIEMPQSLRYHNAPALFVVGHNGNNQLVNYQMVGRYYVVDQLFQKARLLLGTGNNKRVVTIESGQAISSRRSASSICPICTTHSHRGW